MKLLLMRMILLNNLLLKIILLINYKMNKNIKFNKFNKYFYIYKCVISCISDSLYYSYISYKYIYNNFCILHNKSIEYDTDEYIDIEKNIIKYNIIENNNGNNNEDYEIIR